MLPRSSVTLSWRSLPLIAAVIALGCAPPASPRPPRAPLVRSLTLPPLIGAPEVPHGPARVMFAGPVGEAPAGAEITIVFDGPVRELTAPTSITPRISPEVAGQWRWVGTSALRFDPVDPLPAAARFTVELPPSLPSLPGRQMLAAHRFSFETPRPRLVAASPKHGATRVWPNTDITLTFNQPMDLDLARQHMTLSAKRKGGNDKPLPFTLTHAEDTRDTLRLIVDRSLPKDATITAVMAAELRSRLGGLPAGSETRIQLTTEGPLEVVSSRCTKSKLNPDRCDPAQPLIVETTNWVDEAELKKALTTQPPLPLQVWHDEDETNEHGNEKFEVRLLGAKANTTYRLSVAKSLTDKSAPDGDAPAFRQSHRMGDYEARLEIFGGGRYWPADNELTLRTHMRNLQSASLSAVMLTRDHVLQRLRGELATNGLHWGAPAKLKTGHVNQSRMEDVPVTRLIGARRGAVLVRGTGKGVGKFVSSQKDLSSTRAFQRTEVGVYGSVTHHRLRVWVTGLSDDQPIANAAVELRRLKDGASVGKAKTDADGVSEMSLPPDDEPDERYVVFAQHVDDWAYHAVDKPKAPTPRGITFTDRGLYRPNETVNLKGVVRSFSGNGRLSTPAGKKVTVTIKGPHDKVVGQFAPVLSEFGSWHRALLLPPNSPLGGYRVEVRDGSVHVRAHATFYVEEYEPVDFRIQARTKKTHYIDGETLSCNIGGAYLHGAPMTGAKMSVGLRREKTSWRPRALNNYATDVRRRSTSIPTWFSERNVLLDATGHVTVSHKLSLANMAATERVTCAVRGSDLDARTMGASDFSIVHRSRTYLGIRVPNHEIYRGEKMEVGVLVSDIESRAVSVPVELTLLRRLHDAQGDRDEQLASCKVVTNTNGLDSPCTFSVPDEDFDYEHKSLVVVASATAPDGNHLRAELSRHPSKRKKPEKARPIPAERYLEIEGVPSKKLPPGTVVTAHLTSPFSKAANALVTIEGTATHWQQRVMLPPSGTDVSFVVTEDMAPEADINIIAYDGVRSESASAMLDVSVEQHVLKVQLVTPSRSAAPGSKMKVRVQVTDAVGKPVRAEVTLYATDEATLELANYRTPTPEQILWSWWIPRDAIDARADLFAPFAPPPSRAPRVRMGMTSGHGRLGIRRDFRQTMFFEPGLVTDTNGWVSHEVTLPDSLTEYRFIAVATTSDHQFGSADKTVVTNQPLMIRGKMPAVVRAGDTFMVQALVSAHVEKARTATVGIEVAGLHLVGASEQQLTLPPGVPKKVAFEVRARKAGRYAVVIRAATEGPGNKLRDALELSGTVTAPTFYETVALHGTTESAIAEALGNLTSVRSDVGELTVSLSNSPFGAFERHVAAIREYPYGCAEQTASRMIPFTMLPALAGELNIALGRVDRVVLDRAVRRLAGAQLDDGGFGLWAGSTRANPWLTAYVTFVLHAAHNRNVTVPKPMLDRATSALRKHVTNLANKTATPSQHELATAALAIDVLTSIDGSVPASAESVLAERDDMPIFARALLLHALATTSSRSPKAAATITKMVQEIEAAATISGAAARITDDAAHGPWRHLVFASPATATALALRGLARAQPTHPLVHRLAHGLANDFKSPRRHTTHETTWALLALEAYRHAHPFTEKQLTARLFAGDRLLASPKIGAAQNRHSVVIPIRDLAKHDRITFQVLGKGTLHYSAQLRFARKVLPRTPIVRGITVTKEMHVTNPFAPNKTVGGATTRFTPRDLVRVDVRVITTTHRHHVVVDDPLPGGLRAVDPNRTGELDEGNRRTAAPVPWTHRELRDDRVVFFVDSLAPGLHTFTYWARARTRGKFLVPPTQAMEMYAPEVTGSTPTIAVEIR